MPRGEPEYVAWSTRNLLTTLRDRMRVIAALRGGRTSMEQVANEAIELGLREMEKEHPGLRKRRA